jgi:choline monooxygenase
MFSHDPNLATASTIPSAWYTDQEFFKSDCEKIFNQSWNLAGARSSLLNKGDYLTSRAGGENILTLNSSDTCDLKSFINVCRHRAGPLAVGRGNSKILQCKYHGWTYNLDGKLSGTPEFQGVEGFEKEKCALPGVQTMTLSSLVFTSLKPLINFSEFTEALDKSLEGTLHNDLQLFLEKEYHVKCNWKVYVDNYLEGYHIPHVHKGLLQELDYSQYQTITSNWYSEQIAPAKKKAVLYRTELGDRAQYFWLFPNTMLNIYQGLVQTNVVVPISASECIVKFAWYTKSENLELYKSQISEMIHFSDLVQEEDRLICESVQQNLNSSSYTSGRYSVKRENGVHHFHHLLSKMM